MCGLAVPQALKDMLGGSLTLPRAAAAQWPAPTHSPAPFPSRDQEEVLEIVGKQWSQGLARFSFYLS